LKTMKRQELSRRFEKAEPLLLDHINKMKQELSTAIEEDVNSVLDKNFKQVERI